MAIQVPQFQVPALSPAALLQGQQRQSPFQDLMRDIVGLSIRGKIQEQSDERRADLQRELQEDEQSFRKGVERMRSRAQAARDFDQRVQQGDLVSVAEGELEGLIEPEGGFEFFDPPAGADVPEGTRFVRQEELRGARPLSEVLPGRAVPDDVALRDALDPSSGQFNPAVARELVEANIEKTQEMINQIPMPGLRRSTQADFDAMVESGDFFSLAEFEDLDLGGPDMATYALRARQIAGYEDDQRREWGEVFFDTMHKHRVVTEEGHVRQPRVDEARAIATMRMGEDLTETEQNLVSGLRLRPTGDPVDIRQQFLDAFNGASSVTSGHFEQFIGDVYANTTLPDGSIDPRYEALWDEILDTSGRSRPSMDAVQVWAQRRNAVNAPLRAAYAATVNGISTASELRRRVMNGTDFGVDLKNILDGFEQFNQNFFDVPRETITSRRRSRPRTGAEQEDFDTELDTSLSPMVEELSGAFRSYTPGQRAAVRQAVNREPGDDTQQELQRQAQRVRENASGPDVTEAQAMAAESLAQTLEDMAAEAVDNPDIYEAQRDTLVKALDAIGRR